MKKREFKAENFSIVEVSNHKIPTFEEVRGKDWIAFGKKNDYPQYLIDLFNRSAKHNAIVTGKTQYIKGGGLVVKSDVDPGTKVRAEQFLESMNSFIGSDELLARVILDEETFNGTYLELTPDRLGLNVAKVDHIDFSKIRVSKCKKYFWYSNDWLNPRQSFETTGLRKIEPYNFRTKSGLWFYKGYRPGAAVYPIPEYVGAIPYIEIDFEISNYHLNNIKSGFTAGTLLSFNSGLPSTEAQKQVEQRVKEKYTGTDKAGQLFITFAENKDSAPTVQSMTRNGFDDMFLKLNETVLQEIFTGHKITSLALFGIKESKGLGSKDELATAFQLFQNGYITHKQDIITKIFNDIAEQAGLGRPYEIKKTKPVGQWLDPTDVIKVMTPDEIRKEAGLEVIEVVDSEDKKILDSLNSLSPLVATKVLESMTPEEIRKLVGLGATGLPTQMHSHFCIDNFKKFGKPKSGFQIIQRKEVADRQDVVVGEIVFAKEGFAEILYSYEERENLPPLIGEHRDFCQELINLDRLYTRAEIDQISELEGRDVWRTRGGYYHNPVTDRTTTYCRHIWVQNVVKKR